MDTTLVQCFDITVVATLLKYIGSLNCICSHSTFKVLLILLTLVILLPILASLFDLKLLLVPQEHCLHYKFPFEIPVTVVNLFFL